MSDNQSETRRTPPKSPSVGGYLFIPKKWQTKAVILWLRRMHAWTGVYGAIFFLCLGLSGFYLNHRTQMKIEGGKLREAASVSVAVEPGALTTDRELAAWVRKEFNISTAPVLQRARNAERVLFNGAPVEQPAKLEALFRAPNAVIEASHEVGTNVVHVKRSNTSLIKMLTELHKGVGVRKAYVLIVDTIAGALIFMSLSGILLWTRLHGSRLVAVGIMGALALAASAALSGSWLTWTAP